MLRRDVIRWDKGPTGLSLTIKFWGQEYYNFQLNFTRKIEDLSTVIMSSLENFQFIFYTKLIDERTSQKQ